MLRRGLLIWRPRSSTCKYRRLRLSRISGSELTKIINRVYLEEHPPIIPKVKSGVPPWRYTTLSKIFSRIVVTTRESALQLALEAARNLRTEEKKVSNSVEAVSIRISQGRALKGPSLLPQQQRISDMFINYSPVF